MKKLIYRQYQYYEPAQQYILILNMSYTPHKLKFGFKKRDLIKQQQPQKLIKKESIDHSSQNTISSSLDFNLESKTTLHQSSSSISIESDSVKPFTQRTNLSSNPEKIQTLKSDYNILKGEHMKLKNEFKMMQVELINTNKDYYQRENERLKGEVQKYQKEYIAAENKIEIVQNQKRQWENSLAKKNEEVKNWQRSFQKLKMQSIEIKNKAIQKENYYKHLVGNLQSDNGMLSTSNNQLNEEYNSLVIKSQEKDYTLASVQQQLDLFIKRAKDYEMKLLNLRKNQEKTSQEKNFQIYQLENQIKTKQRQSEDTIQRLSLNIETMRTQRQSQQLIVNQATENIKTGNDITMIQLVKIRLEEEKKELELTCSQKTTIISQLENTLKNFYSPEQYQSLQKKYKEVESKRLTSSKFYQTKLLCLQKENQKLNLQKLNQKPEEIKSSSSKPASFDEIVKKYIQEIEQLKKQITEKSLENHTLRQQMIDLKQRDKNSHQNNDILLKQSKSFQKNIKIGHQIQIQTLQNQIDSLKRKLETTQTRLQIKVKQSKQKDEFITNNIVGKSRKDDVPYLMAELERLFLGGEKKNEVKGNKNN